MSTPGLSHTLDIFTNQNINCVIQIQIVTAFAVLAIIPENRVVIATLCIRLQGASRFQGSGITQYEIIGSPITVVRLQVQPVFT